MKVTLTTSEIIAKFGLPVGTEIEISKTAKQEADDGWISNIGRQSCFRPSILNGYETIDVKYRSGGTEVNCADFWTNKWCETDGWRGDIVAYRKLS